MLSESGFVAKFVAPTSSDAFQFGHRAQGRGDGCTALGPDLLLGRESVPEV